MRSPTARRALSSLAILGALGAPKLAAAADMCAHPLQGSGCFGPFSLVAVSYSVVTSVWALGALVILKPRWAEERAWWPWALGAPLIGWLFAMIAFTIFGGLDLLTWPLDASPYFFVNWPSVALSVLLQAGFVVLAYRRGVLAS